VVVAGEIKMRIRKIEVANLRAIRNASLNLSENTVLIGENNSGKSAFLLALDLFFSNAPQTKPKDFSDGQLEVPINITVHFSDLTPAERKEFESNLINDELIVTRELLAYNGKDSGRFFVSAKVNPDFTACRNEENKTERRSLYKQLQEKYDLPNIKAADEIDAALEQWEDKNPDALKLTKVSGFKGWKNVAVGKIKSKTDFILIKAVEDAAENIQTNKNSPVRNLINTIAKQTIENSEAFQSFLADANQKISELTDPHNFPILTDISENLTRILATYYKNSGIIATWDPISQIQPNFPTANIEVSDNDFITGIDGVGHGLQRAVILTVLQFMAEHRAKDDTAKEFSEAQSDIIIAIEEPEIYQHPTKQRLFAKVLKQLSTSFNTQTGIRTQILYVTHCPLMVSLRDCDSIRMVRLQSVAGAKNVTVKEISLDECSKRSARAACKNSPWSASQYAAKLHNFRSEMAEGFFAKCVILVEGAGDKAIMEATYRLQNRDPHAEGILIVDVVGKNKLDRPIVIFEALGIPCFWIFDNDKSDKNKKKDEKTSIETNKLLQRLSGLDDDKCLDWPEGVSKNFAAWDYKLEDYIKNKVGNDLFNETRKEASANFDVELDMCLKFPASAAAMLTRLHAKGQKFPELTEITKAVDTLIG
jgi:predicted ATP-dependent endonuclease of OLD family